MSLLVDNDLFQNLILFGYSSLGVEKMILPSSTLLIFVALKIKVIKIKEAKMLLYGTINYF